MLQSPIISVAPHKPHSGISLFTCAGEPTLHPDQSRRILSLGPPNTSQNTFDVLCCKGTVMIPLAFHEDNSPGVFFLASCFPAVCSSTCLKTGFLIPSMGLGTWICHTPVSPLSHHCSAALSSGLAFYCTTIPQSGIT